MAEVKIGVAGNADAAKAAVNVMTDAVDKLAKAVADANKVPYTAPGIEQASKDLGKLQKQFQEAIKLSAGLRNAIKNSGQNADAGILNIDWTRTSTDPKAAQRIRDRAFAFASRGTAWDQTNVPNLPASPGSSPVPSGEGRRPSQQSDDDSGGSRGSRGRRSPWSNFGARAGRAFTGGIGGGVGQIVGEGISGAESGAAAGGAGAGIGLLGGLGIGAALFGLAKLGQMGAEGYGMARERDLGLDTIKRQMGDLGVSFDQLKAMSDAASEGLGLNAAQFAALEKQEVQVSHGAERSPEALASSVRTSTGFARAYGLDPAQAVGFFGGMKQIDPRQNNRELSVLIAEAISRSGNRVLASDVMQAVQALSSSAARLSLSSPNVGAAGSAYASMMRDGGAGMTADNASALLGQANASVMNMGSGAGEAGMNFILQAMNQSDGMVMNPVQARALAAGGMFGSRASVFGEGTPLAQFFANDPNFADMSKGEGSDVTTFDAIRRKLRDPGTFGGNKWLELDGAQRLFSVSSPQQAAALMNLDDRGYGGLNKALEAAGVKVGDVNASGIATLARVGAAHSMPELNSIYKEISGRTGAGALTDDERSRLDKLSAGGNIKDFQAALIKTMASKDQEETTGSDMRRGVASLQNIQIAIGEQMVPAVNVIRDTLLGMLGKGPQADPSTPPPGDVAAAADDAVHGKDAPKNVDDWWSNLHKDSNPPDNLTDSDPAKDKSWLGGVHRWVYGLGSEGQRKEKLDEVAAEEKKYNLPSGLLRGVWGTESSFGADPKTSSKGAKGDFQFIDGTAKQYGVKIGDFASEAGGAAHYLSDRIKARHGDVNAALADYNGSSNDPEAAARYIGKVRKNGGFGDPANTPVPKGSPISAAPRGGATDVVILDVNMNVTSNDGNGAKTIHKIHTSVPVPRGSGVTTASISH